LSNPTEDKGVRLNRYLARCGTGSRRNSDALIASGLVFVNGKAADSPGIRIMPGDRVECRGEMLTLPRPATLAYNKPVGVEVTLASKSGAMSRLLEPLPSGCVPVGRLDIDTAGLILISNDGDLTFRLTHPRWQVEREYLLCLDSEPPQAVLARLSRGVPIGRGEFCRPTLVERSGPLGLRVVLTTGRYHEVRRMAEASGLELVGLERIRYGPVKIGALGTGRLRTLSGGELRGLYACVALDGVVPQN
jgi:23S rRNA pseudouridine2605 synthase